MAQSRAIPLANSAASSEEGVARAPLKTFPRLV
jgi:hypothetical protein